MTEPAKTAHELQARVSTWPLMLAACAACEAGLKNTAAMCALCAVFGTVRLWVSGASERRDK